MKGTIFDIKHYAIHDGPGIRQTIFFKGCPLKCWWCHNPESRSNEIIDIPREEVIDGKTICSIETLGKKYTIGELIKEVEKDIVFFEESGGGVTLSGGEPLLQYTFALELLRECKAREIHTCVDTTGYATEEKIMGISEVTDLFLFDIKQVDDKKHMLYSGTSNKHIIRNLKILDEIGKDIWIRFPLIPGINDDEGDIFRLMDMLSKLRNNYPLHILPYHKIGSHKYEKFGMDYNMDNISEPDEDYINTIVESFESNGFKAIVGG